MIQLILQLHVTSNSVISVINSNFHIWQNKGQISHTLRTNSNNKKLNDVKIHIYKYFIVFTYFSDRLFYDPTGL